MADISLSKAVRSNLLSLKSTADMMATTQNRLSTGNKVNSALDNPSSWFTAKGLTNRASDLGSLLDSMANGVKTLQAADNGLSAMTKTLESMQSTLRQARQDKSFQTASYSVGANATGNLSFTGGALDATSTVSLTKAQPTSLTAGADFALAGTQAGQEATFAAANFDDADDTITFDLTIDGKTEEVVITKAIADEVVAGGNLNSAAYMRDALTAAITAAGFEEGSFSVGGSGTDILIQSGSKGSQSEVTIANKAVVDGGGADTMAAGAGFGAFAADDVAAATAAFTITGSDGFTTATINLNGDDHNTPEKAVKAINDAIATANAAIADEDDRVAFTASVKDGRIVLTGASDGTGQNIGVAGGGADAVFGTAAQRSSVEASTTGGATKTVDELVTEINSKTLADGTDNPLKGAVRASNDNGKLRIENQSTSDLSINGVNSNGVADGVSIADTTMRRSIDGNSVRSGLADQFNELRDQLDKIADDASFNGINLLRGDKLAITFNETGTSSIDIQTKDGDTINSSNLGVSTTLEKGDLDSDAKIDEELGKLKSALNEVRSQASSFGSNLSIVENRQSFTKAMINTLEDGAGDLTLADMNTEAANLLALQTRQSLSQNSLSLASQADQSILQLIR